MRNIVISRWKSKGPDGNDIDENILIAFNILIGNKRPEELPKGFEKFRLFNRIARAFDKAEKTGTLKLEEIDYDFLKKLIEQDIPSIWGMNEKLSQAIEDFLNTAKEEL